MNDEQEIRQIIMQTFRGHVIVAIALFLSLVFFLVVEELVRYLYRPFYGWGRVAFGQIASLRYTVYAISVGMVILMRLLQAVLVRFPAHFDWRQALSRLSLASLFPLLLAETPALLGLIFFFLTGLQRDFYVLSIVSVILLFMYFPRKVLWEEKMAAYLSRASVT